MASALVASCPDCARLATDIAAISAAVATEPVPPRRRDFRISPEQARALRGSPFQRLMRRFALPSSGGALRPLATGALSIGLVLVFVGSVVPSPSTAPEAAPAAQVDAGLREAADDALASKVAPSPASEPAQVDTIGGAESMTMQMTAPAEVAPSPAAGDLSGQAMDAAAPEPDARALDRSVAVGSPAPAAAVPPLADAQDEAGLEAPERADTAGRVAADEGSVEDQADAAAADASSAAEAGAPIVAEGEAPALTEETARDDATANALDLRSILLVIGVALVAVGVVLALLLVLSRRHPDAARP